ncbi:MAG: hypothetical protein IPK68_01215 [Bdellovibrionales bacterium]|nr:hypothetical protein [Bdellovibrionales bacterium]
MRTYSLILPLIFLATSLAHAEEIPYVKINVCSHKPYEDHRTYWDQTRTFCFEQDGKTRTYDLSDLGEVKLRDNGTWVDSEYVRSLTDQNREEVATYDRYYIRYLSFLESSDGVVGFVAHVFFNWGPGTQTIYVFGELRSEDVRLTGYSHSEAVEGDLQCAVRTAANILKFFSGKNPNQEAIDEVQMKDRRRSKPVQDVVTTYLKLREKTVNEGRAAKGSVGRKRINSMNCK